MDTSALVGILIGGGVCLLCVVLGVVLMTGHGTMLIAGYNTMSPKEREKWNAKAIGRAVGIYLVALGVLLAATTWLAMAGVLWVSWVSLGGTLAGSLFLVIYVNKSGRFRR
jgi:hypothetical protein